MAITKITLAASLGLVLVFAFSCSSDDNVSFSSSGGGVSFSSSGGGVSFSSSGGGVSSSSNGNGCPNAVTVDGYVTCGGQAYKTVLIGSQTWMAENLNYETEGSVCYKNLTSNCTAYGRLYRWSIAMALPSFCDDEDFCSSRINSKHQGICPSGWHIPSEEDIDLLLNYVERKNGCSDCDAKHLKAASGWASNYGLDTYGFSALPGGYALLLGGSIEMGNVFYNVNIYGYWWSTLEYNKNRAYNLSMKYESERASRDPYSKLNSFSVRCVQDHQSSSSSSSVPSSSSAVSSSSNGNGCPNAVTVDGYVTCGGQTYKTVLIGSQTWMAENLNYAVSGSVCYDNSEANCDKYGRLYDWSTSMTVCPSSWHLPTEEERGALSEYVERENNCSYCDGKHLKATSGWDWNEYENMYGNGEDTHGFSALPGGYRSSDGNFSEAGIRSYWWSASEVGRYAYNYSMHYDREYSLSSSNDKSFLRSVRCVQD